MGPPGVETFMQSLRLKISAAALIFSTALVFAIPVYADQAAYISEKQAKKAVKLLKKKKVLMHLCEPCGDTVPESIEIDTIEAVKTGYQDYWEVKVNGKGIDLAYIYYERKKNKWKNAAMKLKIEVSGVSEYLPEEKYE